MRSYWKDASRLRFAMPHTKIAVCGVFTFFLLGVLLVFKTIFLKFQMYFLPDVTLPERLTHFFETGCKICLFTGTLLFATAIVVKIRLPKSLNICYMVKKRLFCYEYGNPLHLKDGELLPEIRCKKVGLGVFELIITATSVTVEDIQNVSSSISSGLKKRFKQYAVTQTTTDLAFNQVTFRIEDVTVDKSIVINDVMELKPKDPTKLIIQKETYIDLETAGSIECCGKTRSGKTTSIICILLQVLLAGRDEYGSEICIIDPKQAELSRCTHHVVTLDDNGEATAILKAVKRYADTIVKRQKILNDLSEKKGDAVKWWDEGFRASFLFVDEYVTCRTLFPKRTPKDNTDYSLATFDALIKRITMMGASAGCYIIVSAAEGSVGEGGLPSLIQSAMTTKILFKPTLTEARFIWDSEKLKDMNTGRVYSAGDAWFSSTDGIHDSVSYVHFPIMNFPVYRELGRLLDEYYKPK